MRFDQLAVEAMRALHRLDGDLAGRVLASIDRLSRLGVREARQACYRPTQFHASTIGPNTWQYTLPRPLDQVTVTIARLENTIYVLAVDHPWLRGEPLTG